ncbi:MAG TPA: hypothetical protein VGA95_06885 [Thermodesulfobacteriota bacterium]
MSKFVSTIVLMLFVGGVVFLTAKTVSAGVYSPGCSQIEGVDATTLVGGTCTVAGTCTIGLCDDGVTVCVTSDDCSDLCSNDNSNCDEDTDCGSSFCGIIGTPGVTGFNKNGKEVDNMDTDDFTDSLEMCINDALIGYCTTKLGDDNGVIELFNTQLQGPNDNKSGFCISFNDTSGCAITECSDHVDNEPAACVAGMCVNGGGTDGAGACTVDGDCDPGDGFVDFPNDPQCSDYDDDDESA